MFSSNIQQQVFDVLERKKLHRAFQLATPDPLGIHLESMPVKMNGTRFLNPQNRRIGMKKIHWGDRFGCAR